MSIHHRQAENAEEIASLLRNRGRIVITAPPRCGKTTELLRYAEERYPNGRFAVVAKAEDHPYIIKLHWQIHNGLTFSDVVAKRLLGHKIEGEDVMTPQLLTPDAALYRTFNPSTPTFVDGWSDLTEAQQKAILRRRLFIAATNSIRENFQNE
jgi:hypothetical protein